MLCSGQYIRVTIIVNYCFNDNTFKLVALDVATFSVVCVIYNHCTLLYLFLLVLVNDFSTGTCFKSA
jgi:hypothetical protein